MRTFLSAAAAFALGLAPLVCLAQVGDPKGLRINEILASNHNTLPQDLDAQFEDMVEIYNPTDLPIDLFNLKITDTVEKLPDGTFKPLNFWKFGHGSILSKYHVLLFCDNDAGTAIEPHATFKLDQDGELVALFTADEVLIDMVVFPRIPQGWSYGRYPDGSDTFCYLAQPTFRNCSIFTGGCPSSQDPTKRTINAPCANVPPEVNLKQHRSIPNAQGVSPAADEAVNLVADTWDDKENQIASVMVSYQVDGGDEQLAPLVFDAIESAAILKKDPLNPDPLAPPTLPDKNRAIWKGQIPGQAAGALVTFHLQVTDTEGAKGTDPSLVCTSPGDPVGCHSPFRYTVGTTYTGPLILNEVCPLNLTIKWDYSGTNPRPEDYIEIYSSEDMSLEGLWLSSSPFHPEMWMFPPDSSIKKGQYLLVWCDSDGTDTDPVKGQYHTSFKIAHEGEGIFIFNTAAKGLTLIDGLKYGLTEADTAWSRVPDAIRSSPFIPWHGGSPQLANPSPPEKTFIRGDADSFGGIDISDAIFILTYLFVGGSAPPCLDAADANDSGDLDLSDGIFILFYLFTEGVSPPPPYPGAGTDPTTEDPLGC